MSVFIPSPLPTSVGTVAELSTPKARTANGAVLSTAGYSSSGDGGGTDWINRTKGYAALPSAGKGVLYIPTYGDAYSELLDKNRVSIRSAGVHPDNAASVNRQSFQALIDAVQDIEVANATHPVVVIPNGVYQIDAPLVLDCEKIRDLTFLGENALYAQIRPSNDFTGEALITLSNVSVQNTLQRCIFREFYLRGDKPDGTRIDFCAKLAGVDNCVFDRMYFANADKAGLFVGYSWSNAFINCFLQVIRNAAFGLTMRQLIIFRLCTVSLPITALERAAIAVWLISLSGVISS